MADKQFFVWAGTYNKEISRREAFTPTLENTPDCIAELLGLMVDRLVITPEQALEMARSKAEVY